MAFGVFIHRSDSIYEDTPAEQYQFPSQYLARVESCIGDWIIYYEPTKAHGSRGYFAIAKVQQVIPDPGTSGMYIAVIEPNSYLDFANPVPFRDADGLIERGLLNEQGRISGRAQSAVRPISAADFNRITEIGLAEETALLPRIDAPSASLSIQETQSSFQYEQERSRVAYLTSRIVRDRVLRRVVLRAYDSRCAITSLKLINGHGRAEVEAAHIKPVESNGPDIVSNGLGGVDSKDSLLGANQIQDCFWGGSLGCEEPSGFERCGVGTDGAADNRSTRPEGFDRARQPYVRGGRAVDRAHGLSLA